MLNLIVGDVEVTPNFFSITFVDLKSYLDIFKNAVDDNNNPIPLIQKYTVLEIKEMLELVKTNSFYITATDSSQLTSLIAYIELFKPHYNINNEPVLTDFYGFNINGYDNLMITAFMTFCYRSKSSKDLILKLYEISKMIIKFQNDWEGGKNNQLYKDLKYAKLPYRSFDVFTIFALNKAGTTFDKDTGEKRHYGKSLKQTSINLQWYNLLEYKLPLIESEEEINLIFDYFPEYKGFDLNYLNKYIESFDRPILDIYINDMMHYNKNDTFIVCELVRLNNNEIKTRYAISKSYDVKVYSSSRSDIANVLFDKFYTKFSGLNPRKWKGKKTERTQMAFKRIISNKIKFKTEKLQNILNELKTITVTRTNKDAFSKNIELQDINLTMALGGLHSKDIPVELWSSNRNLWTNKNIDSDYFNSNPDDYTYIHADIGSMYPSIMAALKICPAHLSKQAFSRLITWLKDSRLEAKRSNEEYIDGIIKEIFIEVIKIVINSIYGKLGFEKGDLYDRLAMLETTINGQLMMIMLIEDLILANIKIISANTDGIVLKLYNRDKEKYETIKSEWEKHTELTFDTDYYECLFIRDINNYCAQFRINKNNNRTLKLECKGDYNPLMYMIDLKKGYNQPIVAKAAVEYFINNVPIMDTLYNCKNILDFCITQNIGRKFHVRETKVINGKYIDTEIQRNVRWYISNNGSIIFKVDNNDENNKGRLSAGNYVTIINELDDKDIEYRNINYKYYYNKVMDLITPIKHNISVNQKGNVLHKTKSGKAILKKNYGMYNSLFDQIDDD